jgi:hypothetical protein
VSDRAVGQSPASPASTAYRLCLSGSARGSQMRNGRFGGAFSCVLVIAVGAGDVFLSLGEPDFCIYPSFRAESMHLAGDYIHPTPRGGRCGYGISLPEEQQDAP